MSRPVPGPPIPEPPLPSSATRILWLLSTIFVVYGTTIPFQFVGDWSLGAANLSAVSLNPFISPDTDLVSIPDLTQNILLFIPFGVFAAGTLQRGGLSRRVLAATALGAVLSLTVETLQLFTLDRIAALSDLLSNTLGAFAGALLSRPIEIRLRRCIAAAHRERWTTVPAAYPALVALLILALSVLQPFDATLDLWSVRWKFSFFRAYPWQFFGFGNLPTIALPFAIATVTLAMWFRQVGMEAAILRAGLVCACLALALEGSQLFIESRMPGLANVLAALAGVAAGMAVVPLVPLGGLETFAAWTIGGATITATAVLYLTRSLNDPLQLLLGCVAVGFVVAATASSRTAAFAFPAGLVLLVTGVLAWLQGGSGGEIDVAGVGAAVLGAVGGAAAATTGWAAFRRANLVE